MSFAIHASHPNANNNPIPLLPDKKHDPKKRRKKIRTDRKHNHSKSISSNHSHGSSQPTLQMHSTGEVADYH